MICRNDVLFHKHFFWSYTNVAFPCAVKVCPFGNQIKLQVLTFVQVLDLLCNVISAIGSCAFEK